VLLTLDGQHVGGLLDAVLEARVQPGVLEDDVGDVERRVEADVEPILVVRQFDVAVARRRDGQTTQPRDAVALRTQQLLAAAATMPRRADASSIATGDLDPDSSHTRINDFYVLRPHRGTACGLYSRCSVFCRSVCL